MLHLKLTNSEYLYYNINIYLHIDHIPLWYRAQRVIENATGCRFLLGEMKYLIFSFVRSVDKEKAQRCVPALNTQCL